MPSAFADLVGFTTTAEGHDAEDTRELLNHSFELAREVIGGYGGTLEKEAAKRRRRAMASRSALGRSGAAAALAVIVAVVVGGCAGLTVPTPPTGGANGSGGNAGGGATVANACTLLTTTEIQSTVGHAVATTTPFENQPGQPGCTWDWPSDTGTDNVSLTVVSPGGQADFASTRAFDLNFAGGFASLGAAAASLAAPIDSGLAQGVGNLFQVGDLANLGDAAFMGPGVTVYALKGDAEIQLQILDVSDAGIPDKTIQLAKIILGRL